MSDSQVTLRTRKFIRNPLLGRKQMVVCVSPFLSLPSTERGDRHRKFAATNDTHIY
jgi:small subunit ribosomal protein S24e